MAASPLNFTQSCFALASAAVAPTNRPSQNTTCLSMYFPIVCRRWNDRLFGGPAISANVLWPERISPKTDSLTGTNASGPRRAPADTRSASVGRLLTAIGSRSRRRAANRAVVRTRLGRRLAAGSVRSFGMLRRFLAQALVGTAPKLGLPDLVDRCAGQQGRARQAAALS